MHSIFNTWGSHGFHMKHLILLKNILLPKFPNSQFPKKFPKKFSKPWSQVWKKIEMKMAERLREILNFCWKCLVLKPAISTLGWGPTLLSLISICADYFHSLFKIFPSLKAVFFSVFYESFWDSAKPLQTFLQRKSGDKLEQNKTWAQKVFLPLASYSIIVSWVDGSALSFSFPLTFELWKKCFKPFSGKKRKEKSPAKSFNNVFLSSPY